ncbi:MAG: TonB-dependent receptor [Chitinophagaceae bacterium]
MKNFKIFLAITALVSCSYLSYSQTNTLTQTIKGVVIDADSKKTLRNVSVSLQGSLAGAITDSSGQFRIIGIPIGRHSLQVTLMGYESRQIAEIAVSSGKEVFITVPLTEKIQQLQNITVSAKRNRTKALNEFASVSARSFSVEETKRYAAAVFDPARMAQNFAGVSNNGDMDNSIVVRGNSPKGVLWRLEGIEIPNPNHFGSLGNSGGAISMLSSSTLGNSDFYTGAFPAEFGNALSGAFDLKFREGNKDKREHSLMIGGLGIEAASEGYFKKGGQSSYLVNFRYSTLSLLKGFLDLGGIAPDYQDLSFKINLPTKNAGTFDIFGLAGINKATKNPDKDSTKWKDDNENFMLDGRGKLGIIGISNQIFLTSDSYIKTVLSASGDRYTEKVDTLNQRKNYEVIPIGKAKLSNSSLRASVLYNNKINSRNTLRVGIIASQLRYNYNQDAFNDEENRWESLLDGKGSTMFYQAYTQWKWKINKSLTLNSGVHASLFALNNSSAIEPRMSLGYQLDPSQSVTLSAGMHSKPEHLSTYFYEKLVPGQIAKQPNKDLGLTKATHFVLAYDKNYMGGIRIKAEAYYQRLYNVPVEKDGDGFFSMLNASSIYDLYNVDSVLVNSGKGKNYGIDLSLEKSFSKNYYFLATGSLFTSTFTTYSGKEFNTRYNRNYQFNIVTGKEWKIGAKKTKIIGINGKVLASGALRDSPIDFEKSKIEREAVYVRDKYFTEKGDTYYRMDIGFSYKVNRKTSTHIFMLDIQNLTNHQNIYYSYYDKDKARIRKVNQMGFFPIFNYRIEF